MAIRSEAIEIKGSRYTVTTLRAYEALETALDVAKMVAPAFEGKDPTTVKITDLFKMDNDALVAALARIVVGADKAVVRRVLDALARSTQVQAANGASAILEQIFDLHFAGAPEEMLQWAAFALRVNYGNFFDASTSDGTVTFEADLTNRPTSPPSD